MATRTLSIIFTSTRSLFWTLGLLVLPAFAGYLTRLSAAAPDWSVNPSDYQFNMNMVIRVSYNNVLSNDAGNRVGVFVGPELRGVATPTNIGGQMYYFVTVYSNQYNGEMLRFRAYYAPDDQVYSTLESVPFVHHGFTGNLLSPFRINVDPDTDFAPEIAAITPDTTLQNLPFDPLDLNDYLFSLDGDPVTWSVTAGPNLTASVVNGILTVAPVSTAWTGTETVQITATENTPNHYIAMRSALFTVLPDYGPPVLQGIPSQTIFPGETFSDFDLDDYLQFNGPCRAFELRVYPYEGTEPDPAWPDVPAGPLPMTVVARPMFAGETLAGQGAKLAAFVGNTLVGTAGPSGTPPFVYYSLSLQNLASGTITFRFYHAENQYLYEKSTSLLIKPGTSTGSAAGPYILQFAPLVPTLGADGTVQVTVEDPSWLGDFPVDFIAKDCHFPVTRRDTATAVFSVTADDRPHFGSPPAVSFRENGCAAQYDAQATDPNDAEGAGLTYSISGGADAGKFAIDAGSGLLSWFNFSPDYENPADDNTDNVYEVLIRVTNTSNLFDELALAVTVTDQVAEPFAALINGGAAAVCMSGSAQLQAAGGNAYLWSTGSANASITVNASGVYTVTVTDDAACTASASITVSENPSIMASAGNEPVCAGSNIQLGSTPSGGGGAYAAFSWEGPNGFSSAIEDPLPFPAIPAAAGAYTVTVTSAAGCTASATVNVAVSGNSAPMITVAANSPLCAGSNLSLQSMPSGGSGVYSTFRWSGPNNYVSSFQNPIAFTAATGSTGVYTVTVTDNAGCTATGTTSVLVKAMPLISATNNGPVCTGKNIQLNASASGGSGAPYTFSWLGVNGFNSDQEAPAAFAATTGSGGAYTVTVTDGGGCTAIASTAVKVNGLPAIMASLSGPVCENGSIALQSMPSGGTAPYVQFAWEGPNYTAGAEDPQPFPAIPEAAGAYTVTVTDHAGCTATSSIPVVIHPVPAISAMSNSPVCEGASLTLTSNPSGGSTPYSLVNWTGPDFYVASVPNPASFTSTAATAGVYQVKVTDKEGCTATATVTVVVNPRPSVSAANNGPVCMNANIDLKATPSGGSGVYSAFNWSGPAGYMGTGQIPPGVIANGTRAGIYYVTVSDNTGCTATASTNVFISPFAAPAISAGVVSPVCAGGGITLGSTPSGGLLPYTAFKWSGPDNYSSMQQTPPVFMASTAAAGVYTVTVTDSRGCAGTSSVSVQVSAPKVSPTASSPICLGSTVYLGANPSGSLGTYVSFSWSGPGGYMASGENPEGFPANAGSAGTYTVTVTDFLNCTASGTVNVSLEANDPPTITCPADQTLTADAGCTAMLGSWTSFATNLSDDCTASGDIIVTQMPDASIPLSGHNDEKTVTLTADDGTGNMTPCTFKVILKDIEPPSIACPTDQTLEAGDACAGLTGDWVFLATDISDNCTAGGSIQVTQSPAANTALFGHDDEVEVTLTADDGNGNTTPCTFKVRLKDVTPPSIACPPDQTLAADASCGGVAGDRTGQAEAQDNCTPAPGILITQMPAFNAPLSGHNAELTVTLTADDQHGNTADCSFKVTLKDVTPPSITCPNNTTVSCAANLPGPNTGAVTASDNCGTPVKTFLYDTAPYDSACINRFRIDRYYRATDEVGNSSSCVQQITVWDNTPPNLIFVPANVTVQCNAIPNVGSPSAVDNCAGAVSVAYDGQTVSNILCTDSYTLTRQWTATDACGNTKTATQRITVRDTQKPLFTSVPANVTVECNAVPNVGMASAVDNCDTDVTVTFDGESRTNGSCPDTYILTRRWKAEDNCGNTRTATQRITVRDTQKPVFTSVPQNLTLECTDPLPDVGPATATDNCDASVSVAYLGEVCIFSANCVQTHEWRRTWRATDNCGNSTTAVQVITVQDFRAPTFTSVPANVTIQCTDPVPFVGNPTATDNCSGFVQITFLGTSNTPGDCPQEYTLTRTWLAQDECGNSVTATQTVTVQDTQAPVFNNPPANVTVACPDIPSAPVVTAQDNCYTNPQVTYQGQSQSPGDCSTGYTITRTWTAADQCGNTATHTQLITVSPGFSPDPHDRAEAPDRPAESTSKDFRIMPNPSSGEVHLDLSAFAGTAVRLFAYNNLGRLVWERNLPAAPETAIRLNLREQKHLPAGIYRIMVENNGERYGKMLVLMQ